MHNSDIKKPKTINLFSNLVAALVAACFSTTGHSAPDASRLGKDLTAMGAEVAGNKDKTIPAWDGADSPTPGYAFGKNRGDYWKFKAEPKLFSIDASNVDKYAEKLTPGQIELIRKKKGYRMDVYPTHRNCGVPQFVIENTKKNVAEAKLAANGHDMQEANVPGIPFPMPENGAQVIWNSKLAYRGVGTYWEGFSAYISPAKGGTQISIKQNQTFYYPWAEKGSRKLSTLPAYESMGYAEYLTPAALAGMNTLINVRSDDAVESFVYFPGQRRVRRMPTYAYDAPFIGAENQYTVDTYNMLYGRIDRFDWKLAGKKEIYIPHNTFNRYNRQLPVNAVLKDDMVNPDGGRYELHRVWVVEATVKEGTRHISPKRTFYLDEDTWDISVAEDYDAQGKMWKVRESWQIPFWEIGGTCTFTGFTGYDLNSGRYIVDSNVIGADRDVELFADSSAKPSLNTNFFSPESMRARSER